MAPAFRTVLAASAALASSAFRADAPQVNATLFSESLCPDCIHFITGVWWTAWNTQGIGYGETVGDGQGIINFNQIASGNARITPDNKTITCQHGPNECKGNTLEVCATKHYPAAKDWLPFIYCLETKASSTGTFTTTEGKACAGAGGLDWSTLDKCWTGKEGAALDVAAYYATASLQPAHQYVPWVTLSDEPGAGTYCNENGCDDFVAAVCAAYTGTKPAACSGALEVPSGSSLRGAARTCPAQW